MQTAESAFYTATYVTERTTVQTGRMRRDAKKPAKKVGVDRNRERTHINYCPRSIKLSSFLGSRSASGEFLCSHGKMCIPEAQVCDGRPQCRDQSDELDCREQTRSCDHRCADGSRCVPRKFLCDGERDCLDGTDEVGCGKT